MQITDEELKSFWDLESDPELGVTRFATNDEVLNACKVLEFLLTNGPKQGFDMYRTWLSNIYTRWSGMAYARSLIPEMLKK